MVAAPPVTKYSKKKDVIFRRSDLNAKLPNHYLNSNHETPLILQRYISTVQKEVTELLRKPNSQQSNLTSDEKLKLRYLSLKRNLTIKGADKGGKIVTMDMVDYIEHCELLLRWLAWLI